jgi:hypothetical protein
MRISECGNYRQRESLGCGGCVAIYEHDLCRKLSAQGCHRMIWVQYDKDADRRMQKQKIIQRIDKLMEELDNLKHQINEVGI